MRATTEANSVGVNAADFQQSVESLREKLTAVLNRVKKCAEVVERINEFAALRDREQCALQNLNLPMSPEESNEVTRQKGQIAGWQKEIDILCKPFPDTEREVRSYLDDLQNLLSALPVEPPQLRDIRAEIERLGIWAAARSRIPYMRHGYLDLQILDRRLQELQTYLSEDQKPLGFEGLKQKKQDFSRYLDNTNLTERQHACLSMKFEYGLSYRRIGERLGISSTTVEEHIRAGNVRLKRKGFKNTNRSSKEKID